MAETFNLPPIQMQVTSSLLDSSPSPVAFAHVAEPLSANHNHHNHEASTYHHNLHLADVTPNNKPDMFAPRVLTSNPALDTDLTPHPPSSRNKSPGRSKPNSLSASTNSLHQSHGHIQHHHHHHHHHHHPTSSSNGHETIPSSSNLNSEQTFKLSTSNPSLNDLRKSSKVGSSLMASLKRLTGFGSKRPSIPVISPTAAGDASKDSGSDSTQLLQLRNQIVKEDRSQVSQVSGSYDSVASSSNSANPNNLVTAAFLKSVSALPAISPTKQGEEGGLAAQQGEAPKTVISDKVSDGSGSDTSNSIQQSRDAIANNKEIATPTACNDEPPALVPLQDSLAVTATLSNSAPCLSSTSSHPPHADGSPIPENQCGSDSDAVIIPDKNEPKTASVSSLPAATTANAGESIHGGVPSSLLPHQLTGEPDSSEQSTQSLKGALAKGKKKRTKSLKVQYSRLKGGADLERVLSPSSVLSTLPRSSSNASIASTIGQTQMAKFLSGFKRFQKTYFGDDSELFKTLRNGQSPKTLLIGCCDSRVDPAIITDCEPGDLFVVRNVANLVAPYNPDKRHHGVSAALEFAVKGLKVATIIVMGHTKCGGIDALMRGVTDTDETEFLGPWMKIAQRAKDKVIKHFSHKDRKQQLRACEHASILLSLENLVTYPWIRERLMNDEISIHGWYFDFEAGDLLAWNPETHVFEAVTESPLDSGSSGDGSGSGGRGEKKHKDQCEQVQGDPFCTCSARDGMGRGEEGEEGDDDCDDDCDEGLEAHEEEDEDDHNHHSFAS